MPELDRVVDLGLRHRGRGTIDLPRTAFGGPARPRNGGPEGGGPAALVPSPYPARLAPRCDPPEAHQAGRTGRSGAAPDAAPQPAGRDLTGVDPPRPQLAPDHHT